MKVFSIKFQVNSKIKQKTIKVLDKVLTNKLKKLKV